MNAYFSANASQRFARFRRQAVALAALTLLASCGGGSDSDSPNAETSAAQVATNAVIRNDTPELLLEGKFLQAQGYLSESASVLQSSDAGPARATFPVRVEQHGFYEVFAWWPQAAPEGSAARTVVRHLDGETAKTVDQSVLGGQWNSLGVFEFGPETPAAVILEKVGSSPLLVDAVRVHFLGNQRPELALIAETLSVADQDQEYLAQLEGTGGLAPYSYRVVENGLPAGLELDASTGVISGIPAMAGHYTFTVEVTDAAGARASNPLSIDVGDATEAVAGPEAFDRAAQDRFSTKSTASGSLSDVIAALPEGEWSRVNTNDFSNVWTPAAQRTLYMKSNPEPSKIIAAWSSFAWDSKRAALVLYGGGHANYRGNDVYIWRASTRKWERGALPSEMRQDALGNWIAIDGPDNAPASAHTYDNTLYLPVIDRVLTLGGAADSNGGHFRRMNTATTRRNTGPYLFDTSRAHPGKVGGSTGSHVQRVNPYPAVVGGNMWSNRDNFLNTQSLPPTETFASGCTGYAQENGKDVVYVRTLSAVYRYTVDSLANSAADTWEKVGRYWSGPGSQATCAYDPESKALVRTATNSVPFVYWNLNTPSRTNSDVRISLDDPAGEFTSFMASKAVDISRCGLDFDPQRRQFALWCGDGRVWMIEPPATLSPTGWTVRQQRTPVLEVPNGSVGTGILGKWKYIPNFDVFMGLQDSVRGNIWIYKPVDWQGQGGTVPGDPGPSPSNNPPVVSVSEPANGSSFSAGQPIVISASASDSDGQVVRVEFYRGTTKIGEATSAPFQLTWQSPPIGSFSLTAVATDDSGASTVSPPSEVTVVGASAPLGTVVIQRGLNDYSVTADTYLSTYHKTTTFGSSALIQDQYAHYSMLTRFAIFQSEGGPVPDGATIRSAKLALYKSTVYNATYGLYPVLKDWDEKSANWNQTGMSAGWSSAGANGAGADYGAAADATAAADWAAGWLEFDVTVAVQRMSNASPTGNYGWRLRALSGNLGNLKRFHTSEFAANPENRPKLTISYD